MKTMFDYARQSSATEEQTCPYLVRYDEIVPARNRSGDGGSEVRVKARPCGKRVGNATHFCAEHAYCLDYLEMAKDAGYPELRVNESLIILDNAASHHAFAERLTPSVWQKVQHLLKMRSETHYRASFSQASEISRLALLRRLFCRLSAK